MTKTTPGAMRATKGPWECVLEAAWGWCVKAGKKYIAFRIKDEADARLIAASPAMLEALQALMNEYKQRMDGDYPGENLHQFQSAYKMARAAIAAATGEGKIG